MPSLREFIRRFLPRDRSDDYNWDTPEFKAERKEWQETCTRCQVLSSFTTFLLNGTPRQHRAFKAWEINTLEKLYGDRVNPSSFWDQKKLESYFVTQIPQDTEYEAALIRCMPSIWALAIYFAEWPFNDAHSTTTSLTFPSLVRAVAFLCGRHHRLFRLWNNFDSRWNIRSDKLVMEYIFRVLAAARPGEQRTRTPTEEARLSSQRDVLDILNAAQPMVNDKTIIITRDELMPTAERLSPPTPPELSNLCIHDPNEALIPLLELCILLFHQASNFYNPRYALSLKKKTEIAREKLLEMREVSFDKFAQLLEERYEGQSLVYDGISLLFNTFVNPQSLITGKVINWDSGEEEAFSISSLYHLGGSRGGD